MAVGKAVVGGAPALRRDVIQADANFCLCERVAEEVTVVRHRR